MTFLRRGVPFVWLFLGGLSDLAAQEPGPRLGVVIVVDQMRADALTRQGGFYTDGLAELLHSGAVFTDAHQDHAITETAVGHATIATGVFPRRHGIVGNTWYDRRAMRAFYASEDTTVQTPDTPSEPGRSPAQLRVTTVGDWLKAASPQSKVVAVALKDRAATFMGGRHADGAYWYADDIGRFVTSTYYRADSLPWLATFNASGRVEGFFSQTWALSAPEETYFVAREDSFATEADGVRVTFPHRFAGDSLGSAFYRTLRISPYADELTFEVARLIVEHHGLGIDAAPDLLFIGASAADYIGHTFGPLSKEAADYYLRLDVMVGDFLRFLTEHLGPDRYVVVLTSDHGVLPLPEDLARRGLPAMRVARDDVQQQLQQAVGAALDAAGPSTRPRARFVNGLVFESEPGAISDSALAALRSDVAGRMKAAPFVDDAFTYEELHGTGDDRPYLELFRRQFPEDLTPDVSFRFSPLALVAWGDYGTTHGSPYVYDTWIPLVVKGKGVTPGRFDRRVRSVDIAPTLARLLGIQPPGGLDGLVLEEVLRH